MSKSLSSSGTAMTDMSTITADSGASTESKKPDIKIDKKPINTQQCGGKQWWQNKTKQNKSVTPKESTFKGANSDMNGHTFQCHGESTHASQFTRTCKELQS
jgi:hypothetical protein